MASPSAKTDSEATISGTSSADVPAHEIPPPVLDAEEEEVAMEQYNQEVEASKLLKNVPNIQVQDWRAFASKRIDGRRTDRIYIHKKYLRKFRSIPEVEQFIEENGIATGKFRGSKLRKKRIVGMDAQDAGSSKSAGRRVSAKHAQPKHSLGQSRLLDDEEIPPVLSNFQENK